MAIFNGKQPKQIMPDESIPFELTNGETVGLLISWASIERLKVTRDESYAELNRILTKGATDVSDNIRVVFAAYRGCYLCENGSADGAMRYEDFLNLVPMDFALVGQTVRALVDPNCRRGSEARF